VNRFTEPLRVVSQCARSRDGMVRAGLMEKMMSRTGHNTEVSELTESELDNVSGGEITVRSTDYDLTQTLCVWSNCLGLMGITFQAGAHGTHPA
jgi:bacteriocin-like protein